MEHLKEWTYTFEKVSYEKQTDVTRKCANCEFWKKPWTDKNGLEQYCHKLGFTENDYCKKFNPKQLRVVEEFEVTTYAEMGEYFAFGRGDLGKIEKTFQGFQFIDQRSAPKMGIPLKMKPNRVLRQDQQETAEEWLKHGYGIVKAPTGWGKTVLWCWLVQHIGLRTLLLAQEVRHLAVGWEGLYEHTNIDELEEEAGHCLWGKIGYDTIKTKTRVQNKNGEWEDKLEFKFKKSKDSAKVHPITFATFQSLNSERGWENLQNTLKDSFGLLWLEEAHHESAETFHKVTKSFNSYYRGGQSATPTRKDQTHCAIYDTIGPVSAVATKEQMPCDFMFISTGVQVPDYVFLGQYPLPRLANFLATNSDVQNILLQWILYDIQNGRKPLYITERKADAESLRQRIHMSGYNVEVIKGGDKLQKQQSEYARGLLEGTLHCIIGTKVIKENYNIPPMDTLHLLYPNFGVESEEQMTGRIRRYVLDSQGNQVFKNKPLIRVYTVNANNGILKKSIDFRRNFYRRMKFEEIKLDPVPAAPAETLASKW
jgi:superfamily II DNA or RNA helicase